MARGSWSGSAGAVWGSECPVDRRARSMCCLGVCSERASERDVSVANEAVVKETATARTAGTLSADLVKLRHVANARIRMTYLLSTQQCL